MVAADRSEPLGTGSALDRRNQHTGRDLSSIWRDGVVLYGPIAASLDGIGKDLDAHSSICGDRVLAIALHPDDHAAFGVAELWGIDVLAWAEIEKDRMRLLCQATGVLIPSVDTVDDVLDRWAYGLYQAPNDDTAAAAAAA